MISLACGGGSSTQSDDQDVIVLDKAVEISISLEAIGFKGKPRSAVDVSSVEEVRIDILDGDGVTWAQNIELEQQGSSDTFSADISGLPVDVELTL